MTQYISFRNDFGRALLAAIVASLTTAAAMSAPQAYGHDGHSHDSGAKEGGQSNDVRTARVATGQHGGQLTATARQMFEVVYQPQETRVYIYDLAQRPLSARSSRGEVVMRIPGNPQEYRYPLQHVAPGDGQHDYLVALVDVSQVRDGDMTVDVLLADLPSREEPNAGFRQTFALSHRAPTITVSQATANDQAAIRAQGICPITKAPLGSMGNPIKISIDGQAVYVCCQGCISKVKKNPELYVKNSRRSGQAQRGSVAPQITVSQATANDQAAIRAQGICPITKAPLGSMGTPIKISIDGQAVYVCCQGCISKVKKNPSVYLAKAAQLRKSGS